MVIFIFFKMAATAILDFQNFNFSTVTTFKRVELHHYAKFCRNRLNRGRDIAIFRFFKTAAAATLDFRNFEFLTVGRVTSVEMRQLAKFRRNRSNRGRNMWVLILCLFGLKMPIHDPFGVFRAHFHQMMSLIILAPKRTILWLNHVIWAM